jgi:hypothetical protein
MNESRIPEDTSRTLALGVSLWAAAVGGGWWAGVFATLAPAEVVALAIFATLFAAATYALDDAVRGAVKNSRGLLSTALALDAIAVAAGATLAVSGLGWPEIAGHALFAPLALFCVPLGVVVHAALFARRAGVTSPARKSPGATRAAT